MLFSIIIPMYNLENYIESTLESILRNDLTDCELILLDDGSNDRTVEMAETLLKEKCLCYYAIIRKANSGVSDTRNQGIMAARGKYILFCDGDDYFEPGLMMVLKKEMNHDADMIAWPYYILQEKGKKISQNDSKPGYYLSEQMMRLFLLEGYKIRLGSFVIKRDVLLQKNVFFTRECTFAEDIEFIMKCLICADGVEWISEPLFCYVKREGSLVNSYNIRRFEAPGAIGRVREYIDKRGVNYSDELIEYIGNGLYVLHYLYALEGCLINLKSPKDGKRLYADIWENYADVEYECKDKLKKMDMLPVGMSRNRVRLLWLGTKFYIYMRLIRKRIKEK